MIVLRFRRGSGLILKWAIVRRDDPFAAIGRMTRATQVHRGGAPGVHGMGTDIAVWMRSPCCACVASGHAKAVLLSTPRNSRRLMYLLTNNGHSAGLHCPLPTKRPAVFFSNSLPIGTTRTPQNHLVLKQLEVTIAGFANNFTTKQLCIAADAGTHVSHARSFRRFLAVNQPYRLVHRRHLLSPERALPHQSNQGSNRATIDVGDTYTDLGAIVHDDQGPRSLPTEPSSSRKYRTRSITLPLTLGETVPRTRGR
jgi:hypothetical protein